MVMYTNSFLFVLVLLWSLQAWQSASYLLSVLLAEEGVPRLSGRKAEHVTAAIVVSALSMTSSNIKYLYLLRINNMKKNNKKTYLFYAFAWVVVTGVWIANVCMNLSAGTSLGFLIVLQIATVFVSFAVAVRSFIWYKRSNRNIDEQ